MQCPNCLAEVTKETEIESYFNCDGCGLKFCKSDEDEIFIDFAEQGNWLDGISDSSYVRSSFSPVESKIFKYVIANVPKDRCIVELFSEVPRLLKALKCEGFHNIYGFDPLDSHRNLLRKNSIDVISSLADLHSIKTQSSEPLFICMESIVRLHNGIEFLRDLKSDFVNCSIIFSTPNPNRSIFYSSNTCNYLSPPNIRTIWGKGSLRALTNDTDSSVKIEDVSISFEGSTAGPVLKKIAFLYYRVLGQHEYSYLVFW
jgi:hypothetical protein